ncbi:MAG: hypothetical protein RLZZ182_451, partial [Pseudomonadota bacterium]
RRFLVSTVEGYRPRVRIDHGDS